MTLPVYKVNQAPVEATTFIGEFVLTNSSGFLTVNPILKLTFD